MAPQTAHIAPDTEPYQGFEQGPIRPPSEARSLLIRVTRNCPWNRCAFCSVYKGSRFSLRPIDHVKQDIDAVSRYLTLFLSAADKGRPLRPQELPQGTAVEDPQAYYAAYHWFRSGMASIFLQDANSLILPPDRLREIVRHLKDRFPWVERITSYARSHTVARIKDEDLKALADAGLSRIHIGMESGSDRVLKMVRKGATKSTHITAGLKVKAAGMELSEYVMPGLGGRSLSKDHAIETADALNRIDPEFIRLRTLALPDGIPLWEDWRAGRFQRLSDRDTAEEILKFIHHLDGIGSTVKSDHILNLFEEVEGKLPEAKQRMVAVLDRFLSLEPQAQCAYQVGRRLGHFSRLSDMEDPARLEEVLQVCRRLDVKPDNVDLVIENLMKRFI